MSKITVMLVDDHSVVRAGYRLLLTQTDNIRVISEASRGEDACQYYAEVQPNVVVMDINLPGIGGLAAIRRICTKYPNAKILAFSVHDEPLYVARAFEAGARGYVTKSCSPDILVDAVQRIAQGEKFVDPAVAQRMVVQTLTTANAETALSGLSGREFDVFCLLAKGRTTREVAEDLCLGHKTVSNYISVLKNKLNVNTIAEMTQLAYHHGVLKQ